MGFYGKVINYLSKAFSKIKIGNNTIQATGYDDTLEMRGDNEWIKASNDGNTIIYEHLTPSTDVSQDYSQGKLVIDKEDISEGANLTVSLPQFDARGHVAGYSEHNVKLNIALEQSERERERLHLQEAINKEAERAVKQEQELSDRIGFESTATQEATGVYAYVDSVKSSILGEGELDKTFDTLQEIAEWINGPGVNATELATEIAKETAERKEADKLINIKLENLNESDNNLKNKALENERKIIALEKDSLSHQERITTIETTYETKADAETKLEAAKTYTNDQLGTLTRTVSSAPNRYISDISQENGLIAPVFQDLPFDYPKAINLEYNEETGDLSFPTYFKVFANGEAPAFIYVYDGGEI